MVRLLSLGCGLAITALVSSCATGYDTVSFCWTTTHRLPPQERFVHVPGRAKQVEAVLEKWISKQGGTVTAVTKPKKMIRLAGNANRLFQEMAAITAKEWQSYDRNQHRTWADGEWERMKDLSEKQIEESALPGNGYRIDAVLGTRTDSTMIRVPVATAPMPIYTSGFTAYRPSGGGFQAITVPGSYMSVPMTKYENRPKTVTFESRMQFYVFETSENSCIVYVYGAPADQKADVVAHYGASIGRAWWPNVTGEHEARLAREAFQYLSRAF